MTDETRAREFWVDADLGQILRVKPFASDYIRFTHVIEYNAYESEKARADRFQAEIEHLKQNLSEACAARDQWRKTHLENVALKSKLAKLKQLVLLTDPAVSRIKMNDLTTKQWTEFIKSFPDEG